MTIRNVLKKEPKTIHLMIQRSCDGLCKYCLVQDCLTYVGKKEIENIEDEVLDLSVVGYDAIRMSDDTILTIYI